MKLGNPIYRHIIKYTGFFGGTQVLNLLAALVRNKIAAILVGPAGLGFVSLYNTAVKLLHDSTNFGIPMSAVRSIAEAVESDDCDLVRRTVGSIRAWTLLIAMLGSAGCCLLSPLLSLLFFEDVSRWSDFLWLAPVVALAAVSACELSVLKGARRLNSVAKQSVINAFGCMIVTLPFLYFFGLAGILPSLLAASLVAAGTVLWFSLRLFPLRWQESFFRALHAGRPMVRLGLAFVAAGIFGSLVEFLVRTYISQVGSVADVGLYNAGYVLTVTYASVVFTAMETDFFPRLSAVNRDSGVSAFVVNRQVEVTVLLVSPLLVVFMLFLPYVVPLLYSEDFMPVVGMARFGILAMLMRAVILPMEYLSLAKGRSKIYLLTEGLYDAVAVGCIIGGYHIGGLAGSGAGLLVAALFNLILDSFVCRRWFGFVFDRPAIIAISLQVPLVVASFFVTSCTEGVYCWIAGSVLVALSAAFSFFILRRGSGGKNNKSL